MQRRPSHRLPVGLAGVFCWLAVASACRRSAPPIPDRAVPLSSRQAVVVSSVEWSASSGRLQRWQRERDDGWQAFGAPIQVSLGRRGMGWGMGLHRGANGPSKREGDGRSPAGVFELGEAFGYAAAPPAGVTVPYRAADERDYYVDDVASDDYNRWQRIEDEDANEPAAIRLRLSLRAGLVQALAGFEIIGSGRDNITAGQDETTVHDGEVSLRAHSLAQFLIEMPGGVVLPDQFAGGCVDQV